MKKMFNKNLLVGAVKSFFGSLCIVSIFFLFRFFVLKKNDVVLGDMYLQFVPVIKDFARSIIRGESIFFSFKSCLGINNSFNLAYTCLSPFNILYILLFNVNDNIVTFIVFALKISLSAASFYYFSYKVLKNSNLFAVIISVLYSSCSYAFVYGLTNIMWLDALIILPILFVGIISCLDENKRVCLILAYSYLFFTQFYIGYMVGIFTLFFVLAYIFVIKTDLSLKEKTKMFFNWALGVFISVLITAFIWSPVLFFILANRVEDSTSAINITTTVLQIVNSLFWGMGYNIYGSFSYIYCGLLCFITPILFFMDKKISFKYKLLSLISIIFILSCMLFTPLNIFMHAFDQPDMCWYRYSFILSFVLCSISAYYLNDSASIELTKVIIITIVLASFYNLLQLYYRLVDFSEDFVLNNNIGFLVNLILIIIILSCIYFHNKYKKLMMCVLFLFCGAEIVSNNLCIIKHDDRPQISENIKNEIVNIERNIEATDKLPYRVIASGLPFSNADSYFGYMGISDFGNQEKYKVRKFLSDHGYASSTRTVDDTGFTPAMNMLLGVKYIIDIDYSDLNTYSYEIEKNDRFLNIGYIVEPEAAFYNYEGRNAFENINNLLIALTGIDEPCFERIGSAKYSSDGIEYEKSDKSCIFRKTALEGTYTISVEDDNNIYDEVYVQFELSEPDKYNGDLRILDSSNLGYVYYNYASMSSINKMNYNDITQKYELSLYSEPGTNELVAFDSINIYGLKNGVLDKYYDSLSQDQFIVTEFKNGYLKGKINVTKDSRFLLTSIPYDPGWKVYVNGMESVPVRSINGTFMGLYLPNYGEYELEFKYECPGLKIGIIVSICGVLALLSVIFEKRLKKVKNT